VFLILAELGLLALAVGTAAAFNRLFLGWGFLASLLPAVVGSWGSALAMRRLRWPIVVAVPVSLLLGAVVLTWRFAPETSMAGIPTPATAEALLGQVRASFSDFSRLVAPVPASDGFLVVLGGLLWVVGTFADIGAFRYRSPVQAAIPYLATFAAGGILARGAGRTGAVVAFGAGVAAYAVTQRALTASQRRWIHGERDRGTWSVLAAGAALALVAGLAGLVVGPRLPGDTEALVDLRALGREGGSRTVVSPFVGVRALLGERSDAVVFTVEADRGAYWRLTSLEQYDPERDIWVSRGTYRRVDGELGSPSPSGVPTERVRQTFRIVELASLWLPVAYQPRRVRADVAISFDEDSSSVVVRAGALAPGTEYVADSSVALLDPSTLSTERPRDRIDPIYTADPGLSERTLTVARSVTAGATTPYATALALQDFFRNEFTYDEDVDYRDAADPVEAFLVQRRGFCQQFSSTFALMARALGLPARVAVGFTPGDRVDLAALGPDTAGGVRAPGGTGVGGFVVRGRHAHAWPEVYLDGVGWVAFEPTPGRGNPQAEQYTGVPPAQAPPPAEQAATTTTTTVAPTTLPGEQVAPGTAPGDTSELGTVGERPRPSADAAGDRSPPVWRWPLVVAAVVAAGLTARVALRRWRRHRLREAPGHGRVAVAWRDALEWLALAGLRPDPAETPEEFARRARAHVDVAGLDDLARAETARRFGAAEPPAELVVAAERAVADVGDEVRARLSRRDRVTRLVR
jgi:transglutaminase-like putative cysteine protease